jgi:Fic family protein
MDIDALGKSPVGELVPITGTDPRTRESWRYWAFVPSPLPYEPNLSMATVNIASKAGMGVARLDQALSQLPNPTLLVRPIIRREAVSTSALEGTFTAFNEVLEADFLDDRQLSAEQREVRNYVYATEQAINLIERLPISRSLLGRLQKTIVRGTEGDTYDAGDLRQRQVGVGPKRRPIHEARSVPQPPGDSPVEGVSDWEKWVNADIELPVVAKIALAHYQFEALHPYSDGNGRLGRLVAVLQLMQEGVLRLPVLNLSPWLENHKDEYMDGLLDVSKTGNYEDWVAFFSQAVHDQAAEGLQTISRLLELKESIVHELRAARVRGSAIEMGADPLE